MALITTITGKNSVANVSNISSNISQQKPIFDINILKFLDNTIDQLGEIQHSSSSKQIQKSVLDYFISSNISNNTNSINNNSNPNSNPAVYAQGPHFSPRSFWILD